MATFSVPVVRIDEIKEHPNADALEIAVVLGYECITRIGDFKAGDLAVYIPEGSIVPNSIIQEMGLWDEEKGKGKLAGKAGNRVKAVRLRKIVSQGLLYPATYKFGIPRLRNDIEINVGDDVAEYLGIVKYEPPVPEGMNGQVIPLHGRTLRYDIENAQRYPGVMQDGEPCVVSEKLHGTWTCFAFIPGLNHEDLFMGGTVITSKGLSDKGLVFKTEEGENQNNLYVRQFQRSMIETGYWSAVMAYALRWQVAVYILGETFGPGVQDLHYGLKEKEFRIFDIYMDSKDYSAYMDHGAMVNFVAAHMPDIELVPVLYQGPFSEDVVLDYRDGKDNIGGDHVREGVVVRPQDERRDETIGRAIVKYVSPNYLLRGGNATEYN